MRSLDVRFQLLPVLSLALVSALPLTAQDASQIAIQQNQIATQQAMQAAQQANQQAMAASQSASQQAMEDNQRAAQNADSSYCCFVRAPKASVKAGSYPSAVTVKLKDQTRATDIYYSLDGWTPTTASMRYEGPITISSTAMLQAIAVDAHNNRSLVLSQSYTIAGTSSGSAEKLDTDLPANEGAGPVLMPGTLLPLVFRKAVNSHGMEVGDLLPVVLAQDVKAGGRLLAAKGTPVVAKATQVDNYGRLGVPGALTFAVRSITLADGMVMPLIGQESKEGAPHIKRAALMTVLIPGVPAGLFVKGRDAEIPAGATLTAQVGALQQQVAAAPDWRRGTETHP